MRFYRRQWIEKIGHALGVAAYILVVFLPLAALAGQSAEWLAGGGSGDLLSARRFPRKLPRLPIPCRSPQPRLSWLVRPPGLNRSPGCWASNPAR
jgi:hypothetical protein